MFVFCVIDFDLNFLASLLAFFVQHTEADDSNAVQERHDSIVEILTRALRTMEVSHSLLPFSSCEWPRLLDSVSCGVQKERPRFQIEQLRLLLAFMSKASCVVHAQNIAQATVCRQNVLKGMASGVRGVNSSSGTA